MSVDHNLYVGPYAVCQNSEITGARSIALCSKKSCKNYKQELTSHFCPDCGSEVNESRIPVAIRSVNTQNLDVKSRLYSPDDIDSGDLTDIWLPNVKYDVARRDIDHLNGAVPLSVDHLAEVDLFIKAFRPELAALETAYGKESVSVQWGIVGYYS